MVLVKRGWTEQGKGSQEHDDVGQQAHDPRQVQGVEKESAQAELLLFEGLGGFDPGTYLMVRCRASQKS